MCIEAQIPMLVLPELPARESLCRTDVHTFAAVTASHLHRLARRHERGLGQHRDPPYAGTVLRGHEETVLSDPSHSGQMGTQFVRNKTEMFFIVHHLGGLDGKSPVTFALEKTADSRSDMIQSEVDDIVCMVSV